MREIRRMYEMVEAPTTAPIGYPCGKELRRLRRKNRRK